MSHSKLTPPTWQRNINARGRSETQRQCKQTQPAVFHIILVPSIASGSYKLKKKYQICPCRNSIFVQLYKTPIPRKKTQEEDAWPWFLRKVLSKHKCKKIHQGYYALAGSVVFHTNKTNFYHTKSLQGQSEAWLEPMADFNHPFDSKCFL